jgi:DNA repair protein RecO (recombination protein O)
MRDEMHLAFLLHRRDYRETSALADFFTLEHGVVSGVVKGARGSSKSQRMPLQPFVCLSISWLGINDLKTIKSVEAVDNAPLLSGAQLFCGLYVNELLLRLLNRYDPYPYLFEAYQDTLKKLMNCSKEQSDIVLRCFEKKVLSVLGYGLHFLQDSDGADVSDRAHYLFESERGFIRMTAPITRDQQPFMYRGDILMAIDKDDYALQETRQAAKRLMRSALSYYLGGKPLHSRQLFQKMKEV